VLRRQRNARVLTGEVTRIDLADRTVTSTMPGKVTVAPYDSLIVAAGASQSYFGTDRRADPPYFAG
jgi:NADH dehydrogenase